MSARAIDPIHAFVETILDTTGAIAKAQDEFRAPARYPDKPLIFHFMGFDEVHRNAPHAFTHTYDIARGTVRLWNDDILPAYYDLRPHLVNLGEDGKAFDQWMRHSRSLTNRTFSDLEEYALTFGRLDESTLRLLHYHNQPSRIYLGPPMANPRIPVETRDLFKTSIYGCK